MGGKASRDKGSRRERELVAELIDRHQWRDVFRVPLSGAMQGYKGDVIGRPPGMGTQWVLEAKARKGTFMRVYHLVNKHRIFDRGSFSFSTPEGDCVIMSYNPNELIKIASCYIFPPVSAFEDKKDRAVLKYISARREWLGEADLLALKGDREPWLFVRYF